MSNIQYQISNIKSQEVSKNYNIHDRMFKFIIQVISCLNKLPSNYENQVYKNQLIRSVTSMGANSQEADGALTDRDFIHGFTLVRKEGKETTYWLKLIRFTNSQLIPEIDPLLQEGTEIIAIVSTIIKNSQITLQNKAKNNR